MCTKDRILNEALRLFSEKGYSDVYVGDIAEAVGIKAPSLYKHYKGKQEIFDSCVEKFYERMTQVRNDLLLPDTPQSELSYQTVDMNQIIEFTIGLFMFYWKDEVASRFRRMLMQERYRNQNLNKIYENLFVNSALQHEETIFSSLIAAGVIKNMDSHVAALRFYTPIYYLLQKYDLHPEQEEDAKKELVSMVTEFCETYKGEGLSDDQV